LCASTAGIIFEIAQCPTANGGATGQLRLRHIERMAAGSNVRMAEANLLPKIKGRIRPLEFRAV
jgi:hypothetical protein